MWEIVLNFLSWVFSLDNWVENDNVHDYQTILIVEDVKPKLEIIKIKSESTSSEELVDIQEIKKEKEKLLIEKNQQEVKKELDIVAEGLKARMQVLNEKDYSLWQRRGHILERDVSNNLEAILLNSSTQEEFFKKMCSFIVKYGYSINFAKNYTKMILLDILKVQNEIDKEELESSDKSTINYELVDVFDEEKEKVLNDKEEQFLKDLAINETIKELNESEGGLEAKQIEKISKYIDKIEEKENEISVSEKDQLLWDEKGWILKRNINKNMGNFLKNSISDVDLCVNICNYVIKHGYSEEFSRNYAEMVLYELEKKGVYDDE